MVGNPNCLDVADWFRFMAAKSPMSGWDLLSGRSYKAEGGSDGHRCVEG